MASPVFTESKFEPSADQKVALEAILDFWDRRGKVLTLSGFAGTGKSTITAQAVKILRSKYKQSHNHVRIAFTCLTGKGACVLREKLVRAGALHDSDYCGTIHKLIYRPFLNSDDEIIGWKRNAEVDYEILIVDEASMVSERIYSDLMGYRLPTLFIGDGGQLPPVEGSFNLMDKPGLKLEKIHRQAENSPIIKLSLLARQNGYIPVGKYGDYVSKISDYSIIDHVDRPEDAMIIVAFNNFRNQINDRVRKRIGIISETPIVGDKIICLRNDHERGIYNGQTALIEGIEEDTEDAYSVRIKLNDGSVLRTLASRHQFGQPTTLKKVPGYTRDNPIGLFDFGYALTCHKAAGSSHPRVLVFEQRSSFWDDEYYRRWLYTSVTRSSDRLLIIGT